MRSALTIFALLLLSINAYGESGLARIDPPDKLSELVNLTSDYGPEEKDDQAEALKLRGMRLAAESVGSQKGYISRMKQYSSALKMHADHYDKVFDFSQLMQLVPGEYDNEVKLYRLPAVIQESRNYIRGSDRFLTATGTSYRIIKNTRLVTVAPSWRDYLLPQLDFTANKPSKKILPDPSSDKEMKIWAEHVVIGWKRGLGQADQEIQIRIDKFRRDFVGMIRYLRLLEQGLIDPDFIAVDNQMVTGGGDELNLDKTTYQITSPAQFNTDHKSWKADSLDPRESFREIPLEQLGYQTGAAN